MSETLLSVDTQVRAMFTDEIDDALAAGVALETTPTSLQGHLNGILSQLKRMGGMVNWYDDLAGTLGRSTLPSYSPQGQPEPPWWNQFLCLFF